MSKNSDTDKHRTTGSSFSPSQLQRKPIHVEDEDEEENSCDEEIEQDSPKKLYPFKDLKEIKRQTARIESERWQKRHPPKRAVDAEKASKFSDYCSLKYVTFFLLSIIAFLLSAIFYIQPEKPASNSTIDLTEFITDVKNKFEGQDLETFHILKSSLKRVVNENSKPSTPSIFTVIVNKGSENTASDFSIYIARKLALDHYVSINQSVFHSNPDNLKYAIDTEIKSKFDNKSLNVAVVDRLHNIPITAAMIFHNYCDHENAPFKRAIFLFIVHLNRKIHETSMKIIDEVAMQALRHIWHDASDDIVDSLITRLTVNVISIK